MEKLVAERQTPGAEDERIDRDNMHLEVVYRYPPGRELCRGQEKREAASMLYHVFKKYA